MAQRSLTDGNVGSSSAVNDLERRLAHAMKNPKANNRKIAGIKEQLGQVHWGTGKLGRASTI